MGHLDPAIAMALGRPKKKDSQPKGVPSDKKDKESGKPKPKMKSKDKGGPGDGDGSDDGDDMPGHPKR
eukprot:6479549-Amphidinium_carterae.1